MVNCGRSSSFSAKVPKELRGCALGVARGIVIANRINERLLKFDREWVGWFVELVGLVELVELVVFYPTLTTDH